MIEIVMIAAIVSAAFLLGFIIGRKVRGDAAPAKRPRKPRKPRPAPATDTPTGDIAG